MDSKNKKLRKASWLGIKIDVLKAIAKFTDFISKAATVKMQENIERQDEILNALEDVGIDTSDYYR